MADLLIAPYLPVRESLDVGRWSLAPILGPDASETVANETELIPSAIRDPVRRLVDAYRVPAHPDLGAIIAPAAGSIGDPVDREAIRPLSRALLAGAVSANPALTETDDNSFGGWSMLTAENASVYGHPNIEADFYAVEIGVLQRVLSARHAESGEALPAISPPVELPVPMIPRFDTEVATATMAAIRDADSAARRLLRTLDWYAVVLSNAEAITLDVRVGAARSALEVLTDSSSETKELVRSFGRLMGGDETNAETRNDVFWARGPVELTADEWWLTRLCELRNAIVHGDEIESDLWMHEEHHQLNHIHDRLVVAVRKWLADSVGDPLLEIPLGDRTLRRATEDCLARQDDPEMDE